MFGIALFVWGVTIVFSLILLMFKREPVSLALMFSAVNAIVGVIFGVSFKLSAGIFLASFGIFMIAVLLTLLFMSVGKKGKRHTNTQK